MSSARSSCELKGENAQWKKESTVLYTMVEETYVGRLRGSFVANKTPLGFYKVVMIISALSHRKHDKHDVVDMIDT